MIDEAIRYYNFSNCRVDFIRHNENMTYKIMDDTGSYVLRIHKPIEGFNLNFLRMGKSAHELITSEIEILKYLSENSALQTQRVIKNLQGQHMTTLENGTLVTVLSWINGTTVDTVEMTETMALEIGSMIGTLHTAFRKMDGINRYHYDQNLLSKMIEESTVALKAGHFQVRQAEIIVRTLCYIREYMAKSKQPICLVHADLGKSNLIYCNNKIIPIDLSLSGYSLPEMDLASVICHINDDTYNHSILRGYLSVDGNTMDTDGIHAFICFQILLFIICQHNKVAGEPWFSEKLDAWCEQQFLPLLSKGKMSYDIGLYQ